MGWVRERDSLGLDGSLLTDLDVVVNEEGSSKNLFGQ